MTDFHTPPNFDIRVLTGIKAVVNYENQLLFQAWRQAEGGTAKWNPLNTTLKINGFIGSDYNNNTPPVQNYPYEFIGIAASIATFASRKSDGTMDYGGIVNDLQDQIRNVLQHGTKTADQIINDNYAEFKTWGTNPDTILQIISELRTA